MAFFWLHSLFQLSIINDETTPQSSEISQTDQNLITSSDTVHHEPDSITFAENTDAQAVTSGDHDGISQDVVTTSTDDNSQPQTLYVAIQPRSSDHNDGEVTEDQPAVYVEVVEASNLSDQIATEGQVLEGQMIIEQGKFFLFIPT